MEKAAQLSAMDRARVAKSFTELAIQNNLISVCADASDTALEVVSFYQTIVNNLNKDDE